MHIFSRDQQAYHLQRTEGEKWFSRLNTLVVGLNLACLLAAIIRLGSGGSNSMTNSFFTTSPLRLSSIYTGADCFYEGDVSVGGFQAVLYRITPGNIGYFVSHHVLQIRLLLAVAGIQVVLSITNRTFFEINIHELRYNFLSFKKDMLTMWEILFLCFGAYLSFEVDKLNKTILNYLTSCSEAESLHIYNTVLPLVELQLSFVGTLIFTAFNMLVAVFNLVGKRNPIHELQKRNEIMRREAEELKDRENYSGEKSRKESFRKEKDEKWRRKYGSPYSFQDEEDERENNAPSELGSISRDSDPASVEMERRRPVSVHTLLDRERAKGRGEKEEDGGKGGVTSTDIPGAQLPTSSSLGGTRERTAGGRSDVFKNTTPSFPAGGLDLMDPSAVFQPTREDTKKTANSSLFASSSSRGGEHGGDSFYPLSTVVELPVSSAMEVEDDDDEQKAREDELLLAQVLRKKYKASASQSSPSPAASSVKYEGKGRRREEKERMMNDASRRLSSAHLKGDTGGFRVRAPSLDAEEEFRAGEEGGNVALKMGNSSSSGLFPGSGKSGAQFPFSRVDNSSNSGYGGGGGGGGGGPLEKGGRHRSPGGGASPFSSPPPHGVVEHFHLQQQRDRMRRLEQVSVDSMTDDTECL